MKSYYTISGNILQLEALVEMFEIQTPKKRPFVMQPSAMHILSLSFMSKAHCAQQQTLMWAMTRAAKLLLSKPFPLLFARARNSTEINSAARNGNRTCIFKLV